ADCIEEQARVLTAIRRFPTLLDRQAIHHLKQAVACGQGGLGRELIREQLLDPCRSFLACILRPVLATRLCGVVAAEYRLGGRIGALRPETNAAAAVTGSVTPDTKRGSWIPVCVEHRTVLRHALPSGVRDECKTEGCERRDSSGRG